MLEKLGSLEDALAREGLVEGQVHVGEFEGGDTGSSRDSNGYSHEENGSNNPFGGRVGGEDSALPGTPTPRHHDGLVSVMA